MKANLALSSSVMILGILVIAAAVTVPTSSATPKFFDDDPVWVERDTQNAAGVRT